DDELKESAKDIIDAADKFGVVGLKLEAEASCVSSMDIAIDNVIDNLLYADAKNCALLKEAVMDFLVENGKEAIENLSFDNVPGSFTKDLLTVVHMGNSNGNAGADSSDFTSMRVCTLRKLLHETAHRRFQGGHDCTSQRAFFKPRCVKYHRVQKSCYCGRPLDCIHCCIMQPFSLGYFFGCSLLPRSHDNIMPANF
ncbi:hypothetical protein ACHAWF_000107, partial [Thalassiosira exigua]